MERDFSNENMEEFLRRNADGLRMRPSARVWKGISSHLKNRRRRVGFMLGTLFLLTTALGYYSINESGAIENTVANRLTKTQEPAFTTSSPASVSSNDLTPVNKIDNNRVNINNRSSTESSADKSPMSFAQARLFPNEEVVENTFTPTIMDSDPGNEGIKEQSSVSEKTSIADPFTIESVLNSFAPKAKKLKWQMYFTPTVSYRKLSDNYIDNVATHKPAFGFELGLTAKYPVSKNIKLKAGLQFNVNRYEIRTYDSYSQLATIRVTDGGRVDSIRTVTNYNNFSGYQPSWLQNFYLQVSAPVGVELKIKGDDKVQFGIASSIQPTYLLGDRAYLISADYKNYAEMPKLVRKWNVNTSLETFVAYSTGHLNWQVGPQVRYQVLSSYLKKYPVKENLFDFGLKVGIAVNK